MADGQRAELLAPAIEEWLTADHQPARSHDHARQAAGRSGIRKQAATATGALRRLYLDELPLCALSAMRSLAQEI